MNSFKKSQRILNKNEFDSVFHRNEFKLVCRDFVFVASSSGQADKDARLGLVVSRKVGGAVARNFVKRCVREQFRTTLAKNRALLGLDVVVVARHSVMTDQNRKKVSESFRLACDRLVRALAGGLPGKVCGSH